MRNNRLLVQSASIENNMQRDLKDKLSNFDYAQPYLETQGLKEGASGLNDGGESLFFG